MEILFELFEVEVSLLILSFQTEVEFFIGRVPLVLGLWLRAPRVAFRAETFFELEEGGPDSCSGVDRRYATLGVLLRRNLFNRDSLRGLRGAWGGLLDRFLP